MKFKSQAEYFSEMLSALRSDSGLPVSAESEPALRLKALAYQLELLGAEGAWVFRQSFPQTADGEQLDRHAALRDITRTPAAYAEGTVRFYTDSALGNTVEKGTVVLTPAGDRFYTTETLTIPEGRTFGDAHVRAEEAGAAYNIAAGTITAMALPPLGVTWCENREPFSGGADAESDSSLRERLLASYKLIKGAANAAYYRAEALAVDGVAAVEVIPRANGRGTVTVYIASAGGVPDGSLVEAVRARLNAAREVAVDVTVLPPTVHSCTVSATLYLLPDTDRETVRAAADAILRRDIFSGSSLGKRRIYPSEIVSALTSVEGVHAAAVTVPTAPIDISSGEVAGLTALNLTFADAEVSA